MALKINAVLKDFLAQRKVRLIDFKTEYGIDSEGNIILADEITPGHQPPVGLGHQRKAGIKTVSAATWAMWKKPTTKVIRRLTGEGK